jgi:hypothetical protein
MKTAITICVVVFLTSVVRADFVLGGNETLVVNDFQNHSTLFDTSKATVASSGLIYWMYLYDTSHVAVMGGEINRLFTYNNSIVDVETGAGIVFPTAHDTSTINITCGGSRKIVGFDNGLINISGGTMITAYAYESSTITFIGKDFRASGGLSLNNGRVSGSGTLSGMWNDNTRWAVDFMAISSTANVNVIPEPCSLLLLGLGCMVLRRNYGC